MVTILSYNIYFGKKLSEISEWLNSLANFPDIVCFQEFPKDHQEKFMKKIPQNYKAEFARSFTTKSKTMCGELTVFNSDTLTLENVSILNLGKEPLFKIIGFDVNRTSLVTVFKIGNKKLIVANSHLTWLAHNIYRIHQLDTIIKSIDSSDPTIILGDYNYSSHFGKKRLISFMNKNGFDLALNNIITHTVETLYKRLKLPLFKHQLDYLFYRNCKLKSAELLNIPYSDHLPTKAVLEL